MKNIICNSCGFNQYTLLLKGRDRLHKIDNTLFNIVKCLRCGLVFINPQPTVDELDRYYPKDYGPYQDNNDIFKYGPVSSFFRKFINQYSNKCLSIEPVLSKESFNYLDFGCGGGGSLTRVKARHPNWNLYGLDNNVYACERIKEKGFGVFCGDILKLDMPKDFFNRVHMSHVIEHLLDPKETLLKIHTIMKSGSKIVISTPNFDSLAARVFRTYWYALEVPRHLFLFTPTTLKKLLEDTGFIVERIEFDKGPKVGIRSLYYLLGKKDLRINPFIWRLFKPISYVLSRFGKTSIMTIYARKT